MKWLSKALITDLSSEINIPEAFIEKDLHVLNVLNIIKDLDFGGAKLVFAGGTALSKGHRVINRFSEDIDLIIAGGSGDSKSAISKKCSKYRENIIEQVANTGYSVTDVEPGRDSRFFTCNIKYDSQFDIPVALRQDLKLDVTFGELRLEPETRQVESFFYEYDNTAPMVILQCMSLTETAANKIAALLWRVHSPKGLADLALTRHLYDLSSLKPHVMNETLKTLVADVFETDRRNQNSGMTLESAISQTISELKTNPKFAADYATFVDKTAFNEDSKIPFDKVLEDFSEIMEFIVTSSK